MKLSILLDFEGFIFMIAYGNWHMASFKDVLNNLRYTLLDNTSLDICEEISRNLSRNYSLKWKINLKLFQQILDL